MSIDRQALFDQIYAPIFESAGVEGELLNCGPIVQGPYCPPDNFQDTYDPAAAEAAADRRRLGEGRRRASGPRTAQAPEIRWMVNAGNTRRENTQAYLIPLLAAGRLQRRRRQLHGRRGLPAAAASARLRHGDVHLDGAAGPART